MEGVGPYNVRPILFLGAKAMIGCAACQYMYLHTSTHPVCADVIRHQCVPLHYCSPSKNGWCYYCNIVYCNVFSPLNKT